MSGLWGVPPTPGTPELVQGSQSTAQPPTSTGPPLPELSCSYVSRSHWPPAITDPPRTPPTLWPQFPHQHLKWVSDSSWGRNAGWESREAESGLPTPPPDPIQLEKAACHRSPMPPCPPLIQPSKLTQRLGLQLLAKSPKRPPSPLRLTPRSLLYLLTHWGQLANWGLRTEQLISVLK